MLATMLRAILNNLEENGESQGSFKTGFMWVFGVGLVLVIGFFVLRARSANAAQELAMRQSFAQEAEKMKEFAAAQVKTAQAEGEVLRKEMERQRAETERQRVESERRIAESEQRSMEGLQGLLSNIARGPVNVGTVPPKIVEKEEAQSVTVNGVKCEVISASRNGSRVVLNMVVTSIGADIKMWPPSAEAIDSNGNHFTSPRIGGMQNAPVNVFEGVKTRCTLVLYNVPLSTKVLARVVVHGLHAAPTGYMPAEQKLPATFTNVKIG
jgi:hypothetical protein